MRIAVPIHSFELGGVERTALRLAQMWQDAGEVPVIVLGRDSGAMRGEHSGLDYRLRPEPIPTARWETPWLIWCLWRFLRRQQVDMLFCPGNTYSVVCVAVRVLLGRGCPPIVATISNDLARRDLPAPARWLYHRWLRFQAPFFARIIAMAPDAAREIERFMGARPEAITVIENPAIKAADLRLVPTSPAAAGATGRRFLAVGRLEKQKNFALLLRAFSIGRRAGDTLTILGEGRKRADLERLVRRLGLGDCVAMPGFAADAPDRIGDFDALLLSSDYEGLGNVIVEALARCVPVITTDCSSTTPYLMRAREFGASPHGWLVPAGDTRALAIAIQDFDSRRFDCESALALAGRFTLEKAGLAYREVMQAVLQGSRVRLRPGGNGLDGRRDWAERWQSRKKLPNR